MTPTVRLELTTPGLEVRCAIHCATRADKQNLGSNQGPLGHEPNTLPLRHPAIYILNIFHHKGGSNPRPHAIFIKK